jgi:hypothetical protein
MTSGRLQYAIHQAVSAADAQRERRDYARERLAWAEGVDTLYKLRSLSPESREHTLDTIENSRLYFPSPEQFNDPFDCFPPFELGGDWHDPKFVAELEQTQQLMVEENGISQAELDALQAKGGVPSEHLADTIRQYTIGDLRRETRILCLAREHCHPLMWSHYASSHTGICLHLRSGRGDLFGDAKRVLYRDERLPVLIPWKNRQSEDEVVDRLAFEKAAFWSCESEYRILGWPNKGDGPLFDQQHRVAFDPTLLCGITLGMRVSEADRARLLKPGLSDQAGALSGAR